MEVFIPAINFQTNADLDKQEIQQKQDESSAPDADRQMFLSSFAGYVRNRWDAARYNKTPIEQRMIRSKRDRMGIYEPSKIAAMQKMFGKDYVPVWMHITNTKCKAISARLKDIFLQPDEVPWDILPPDEPELPDDLKEQLKQNVMSEALNQIMASGQQMDRQALENQVEAAMPMLMDKLDMAIADQAKKAADKLKKRIKRQFAEGGWENAIAECLDDIATFHSAILKGPMLKKKEVRTRKYDPASRKWLSVKEDKIITSWERRSPLNIYPSPQSCNCNDGYMFDLVSFTPKNLSDMVGIADVDSEAIKRVLIKYREGGLREWTGIEAERAVIENKESYELERENIDALEILWDCSGQDVDAVGTKGAA